MNVIFEIGMRGVGYLLCRPFDRHVTLDSTVCAVVGGGFWLVVGIVALVYLV